MSDADKIRLQGVGWVPSAEAQDLVAGDRVMWNGGSTSTVTGIERVSPAFLRVSLRGEDGEDESPRRWKRTARIARVPRTA